MMSEENTDIPTVAEVEYIKDTNGRIGVIGSIIPKISYEELVEKDELIRLSDHEQAMKEQREEVVNKLEEILGKRVLDDGKIDCEKTFEIVRKGIVKLIDELKGEDEAVM